MENVVEINGNKYTEEEVQEKFSLLAEKIKELCSNIKDFFYDLAKKMLIVVKNYIRYIKNNTPVGYKRYMKMDKLKEYEANSIGKSNNWRKQHGLHLRRKF